MGLYVPTTQVWDVQQFYDMDVNSPQFKELLVRLYQNLNNIAVALNLKESAYYMTKEFLTGQVFFNPDTNEPEKQRPGYRQVVNFGALPAAGIQPIPHGLTLNAYTTATHIYGAATNPTTTELIPLPYSSTVAGDNIEVWIDATNVNIRVAANWSTYTRCIIVIEYLKS
jgi:hypothetical protein